MATSLEVEIQYALHPSVVQFLEELELAAKQEIGLVPEQLLYDTREWILSLPEPPTDLLLECESVFGVRKSAADNGGSDNRMDSLDSKEVGPWLRVTIGTPEMIVARYLASVAGDTKDLGGNAPGWRLCCVRCGRSAPAGRRGWIRLAARSVHKYVGGWCDNCKAPRSIRVIQDLETPNLTRRLGATKSPQELRQEMHDPTIVLRILAVIFGSLALIVVAIATMFAWLSPV